MSFPWIRTIAALEMVGGVSGILFVLYVVLVAGFSMPILVVGTVCIAISVLSLLAGSWLWQGLVRGRTTSLIVQFIQLPKLVSVPLVFTFSFGFDLFPHLTILPENVNWGIQLRFLSDSQLYINTPNAPLLLGVSIPAIIAIAKLWDYDPTLPTADIASEPPGPEIYFGTEDSSS